MSFFAKSIGTTGLAIGLAIGLTAGVAEAGEHPKSFNKCKACHTYDEGGKNRVGPNLWGVAGAPAGAKDGFRYSKAMEEAASGGLVWTDAELDAFLKKPRDYMKGTKMSFPGLKDEADRAEIITFLNSLK